MSSKGSTAEWREEAQALERFAMALTPDARFTGDRASAAFLAESLINRSLLALHNGDGPTGLSPRSRLLCLFVRFHRRHVRLRSLEEESGESCGMRDGALLERVVASLPLEWREALLLVVLERLSHVEAASVLEIPLTALLDRLVRARKAVSQALPASIGANAERRRGASHLRLIQ